MTHAIAEPAAHQATESGVSPLANARLGAEELFAAVRVNEYWAKRHASMPLPSTYAPAATPGFDGGNLARSRP